MAGLLLETCLPDSSTAGSTAAKLANGADGMWLSTQDGCFCATDYDIKPAEQTGVYRNVQNCWQPTCRDGYHLLILLLLALSCGCVISVPRVPWILKVAIVSHFQNPNFCSNWQMYSKLEKITRRNRPALSELRWGDSGSECCKLTTDNLFLSIHICISMYLKI